MSKHGSGTLITANREIRQRNILYNEKFRC